MNTEQTSKNIFMHSETCLAQEDFLSIVQKISNYDLQENEYSLQKQDLHLLGLYLR